jgi:hypothetical protein
MGEVFVILATTAATHGKKTIEESQITTVDKKVYFLSSLFLLDR